VYSSLDLDNGTLTLIRGQHERGLGQGKGKRFMAIRRIGQILVDLGFITDDQLEMLLEEQEQRPGEMLSQIAMELGMVTDDQLAQALAEQMNLQVINLADITVPPEVLAQVTQPMAEM